MASIGDPNSRYQFAPRFLDNTDATVAATTFIGSRTPIRFEDDRDNEVHVVTEGDTLENICFRIYRGFQNPSLLLWALAEFQPTPILDPTRKLPLGSLLILPSANLMGQLITSQADEDAF